MELDTIKKKVNHGNIKAQINYIKFQKKAQDKFRTLGQKRDTKYFNYGQMGYWAREYKQFKCGKK